MTAEWWSQRFAPEGSAASEGIRRQLGTPKLDPLAVLVREAAQNSWDAKESQKVNFAIHVDTLGVQALEAWSTLLLPGPHGADLGLEECLHSELTTMITVSDRGTSGLGGPIRADQVSRHGLDFVNLVRNVGEPRDKLHGGGTYGFGKGIFFTLSKVGTILVHSRCHWNGHLENRLIGVSLGHSYSRGQTRYTGRHWWGSIGIDGIPDPLLNESAVATAHMLGMPSFEADDTGTDIVVIDADLGLVAGDEDTDSHMRDANAAGNFLASAMLWNLWPLLTADADSDTPMFCEVRVNSRPIRVPEPRSVGRLRPFVDAYGHISSESSTPITRRRPTYAEIGRFSAKTGLQAVTTDWRDDAAPFVGPARHCALMRQASLVVKYVEGPALASDGVQYGAVFRSAPAVDDIFASAEPPTHDDWVGEGLPDEGRRTIESALRSVRSRLDQYAVSTAATADGARRQPPLGQLSQRLSTLLPGASGEGGASRAIQQSKPTSGGSRATLVRIVRGPVFATSMPARIVADIVVSQHPFDLMIVAAAEVVVDSGRESEPPAGAGVPRVIGFHAADGSEHSGDRFILTPDAPREWTITVEPTPGAVARIRVHTEAPEVQHAS